jgi:hypothetical protein
VHVRQGQFDGLVVAADQCVCACKHDDGKLMLGSHTQAVAFPSHLKANNLHRIQKEDADLNKATHFLRATMNLPKKYEKACLLLSEKREDEFIAFATKEKLAYDIGPVSAGGVEDDSLIAAATSHSLWRCVAFMLDGAAVTIDDVARTYGYAPQAVSDQIWRAFVATNDGVPVKMKPAAYDPEMPLADLFALAHCHPALIKLLVSLGEAPGKKVRVSCDTNLPLALWSISGEVITEPTWTPGMFAHFLATYDPAEIGIDNESINGLLRDWSHSYQDFAKLCFAAGEDKRLPWSACSGSSKNCTPTSKSLPNLQLRSTRRTLRASPRCWRTSAPDPVHQTPASWRRRCALTAVAPAKSLASTLALSKRPRNVASPRFCLRPD